MGKPLETSFEILCVAVEMQAHGRYAEFLERERYLIRQVQAMPKAERLHSFTVELRAMQVYMRRDNLSTYARQITCPTLVLHGSDDRMVPLACGEELAELIPTARKQIITGEAIALFIVLSKGDGW